MLHWRGNVRINILMLWRCLKLASRSHLLVMSRGIVIHNVLLLLWRLLVILLLLMNMAMHLLSRLLVFNESRLWIIW